MTPDCAHLPHDVRGEMLPCPACAYVAGAAAAVGLVLMALAIRDRTCPHGVRWANRGACCECIWEGAFD
jgi:hypothetical protein